MPDTIGETLELTGGERDRQAPPVPGLLLVFSAGTPLLFALPLVDGVVTIGRGMGAAGELPDQSLSRRHAELARDDAGWSVRDLGSRNGSFVDGERVDARRGLTAPCCVRFGQTVVLLCDDVRPFALGSVRVESGQVIGPRLAAPLERVRRAARAGDPLLVTGESGSGKEWTARRYHAASAQARGPFVSVQCAALPPGRAGALLFGDGSDDGYAQAADGGVLFLDDVDELDGATQAQLLRLIESRQRLPSDGGAARPVDVRLVCASRRPLTERIAEGAFRADLFFRLAPATIELPSLRARPEEIAWLVDAQLRALPERPGADARLIEACLSRPWPGNVRELMSAVRMAAREREPGEPLRLAPGAGEPLVGAGRPAAAAARTRETIERALAEQGGNVAATARALAMHRTALYRLMKQLQLRG